MANERHAYSMLPAVIFSEDTRMPRALVRTGHFSLDGSKGDIAYTTVTAYGESRFKDGADSKRLDLVDFGGFRIQENEGRVHVGIVPSADPESRKIVDDYTRTLPQRGLEWFMAHAGVTLPTCQIHSGGLVAVTNSAPLLQVKLHPGASNVFDVLQKAAGGKAADQMNFQVFRREEEKGERIGFEFDVNIGSILPVPRSLNAETETVVGFSVLNINQGEWLEDFVRRVKDPKETATDEELREYVEFYLRIRKLSKETLL